MDVPEDLEHIERCLRNQTLFKELTGIDPNDYFVLRVVEHEGYGREKETT